MVLKGQRRPAVLRPVPAAVLAAAQALGLSFGLGPAAPVAADVSFEEMMHERPLQGRSLTPEALAAAQRQLEEERAADLAEQRRLAQAAARLAEEELRRRAAMPLGARLVEDRCTLCHPPEVVAAVRHAWPGWAFTVARMRYWHGAPLAADELAPVIGHLASTQPTDRASTAVEYALSLGFVLVLVLPVVWRIRRRHGRATLNR